MALCSLPRQAHLPSGTELRWFDSWAGREPDAIPPVYHTILALHGMCFNSRVWEPIISSLPPSIRFVAYNQRGYEGSSPHLDASSVDAPGLLAAYTSDLVLFFDHVITELKLPTSVDGGGIILLGWSKGSVSITELLTQLLASSPSLPSSLTTHLTAAILFEPAGIIALDPEPTADILATAPSPFATIPEAANTFMNYCLRLPQGPPPALAPLLASALEPAHIVHGWQWGLAEPPWKHTLAASPVPLGLLIGTSTNEYFADMARTLSELWGLDPSTVAPDKSTNGLRLRRDISGGNHCSTILVPELFAHELTALVRDLVAPRV